MDVIIFFKAIGNLLFTAILLAAVVFTGAFSVILNLLKGCKPAALGFKSALQARLVNRDFSFLSGKKVLPQKKF